MFRSVGAVIFGIASDRYGRKWPFIINNILFIILELVSLSVQTTIVSTPPVSFAPASCSGVGDSPAKPGGTNARSATLAWLGALAPNWANAVVCGCTAVLCRMTQVFWRNACMT